MNENALFLGKLKLKSLFQRVLGLGYLTFIPFCFFGPIVTPTLFAIYYLILHLFYLSNATRVFLGAYNSYKKAVEHSKTNWKEKYSEKTGMTITDIKHDIPFNAVKHIIIIPQYKEDLDTMYDTLDVLSSHEMAISHYKICLAMEEAENESASKATHLMEKYEDKFMDITFTQHPYGRPGEIRGKSSNVAWAAREMVRQSGGPRLEEIITIMDSDTGIAQDYFEALSYHYSVATPQERSLMFFSSPTVFDRNCDQVPFIVRCADMSWSVAIMCNLYESSPIKFPVSSYSIPVQLAANVGYWDTDPCSIGEDFHMYLKCFFSTFGQIKPVVIYSAASCCHVQGKSWFGTVFDRYTQAKRHMWASIDFGYALRRTLFAYVAPGYDAPTDKGIQPIPLATTVDINGLNSKLLPLFHRIMEAHFAMGQVFFIIVISTLFIPFGDNPFSTATLFWNIFSSEELHPHVELALIFGDWLRLIGGVFFVIGLFFYEKYQRWSANERWLLSLQEEVHPGTGRGVSRLGKHPILMSRKTFWNYFDWLGLPICGFVYLAIPQVQSLLLQLYTDSLDYVVAGKPTNGLVAPKNLDYAPVNDTNSNSGRGDSGYYDFDTNEYQKGIISPSLWKDVSISISSPSPILSS